MPVKSPPNPDTVTRSLRRPVLAPASFDLRDARSEPRTTTRKRKAGARPERALRRPAYGADRPVGDFGALPLHNVELFRFGYQVAKRVLDLTICLLILVPVFSVMAACAVAVWLGDGRPVMFAQYRTGRGGRRFKLYKFRTMLKNAEELKQKYWHLNRMSGPEFKLADDPRVTRVGRILRKYSLDELPQIINVLRGEMSLVGPRPTSFDAAKYALWQTERLEVLPGITGLAQVSGRSELSFEEKLARDIEYVERRSLRLDLRILLCTIGVVFSPRGAY
jgi:lipopolysaccharide/colanic/teichoic acid biosynthesis glycosyltransferase